MQMSWWQIFFADGLKIASSNQTENIDFFYNQNMSPTCLWIRDWWQFVVNIVLLCNFVINVVHKYYRHLHGTCEPFRFLVSEVWISMKAKRNSFKRSDSFRNRHRSKRNSVAETDQGWLNHDSFICIYGSSIISH